VKFACLDKCSGSSRLVRAGRLHNSTFGGVGKWRKMIYAYKKRKPFYDL
jgi:hypothetical protein